MPNCWIITNRRVRADNTVDEAVNEPLPVFRIAAFEPLAPRTAPTRDRLRAAVTFYPDVDLADYGDLRADTDPAVLPGTKRMFLEAYNAMAAAPATKGDTLVFLHGFNYAWDDSLLHLQQIVDTYVRRPGSTIANVIYFSWPSHGTLRRYLADQEIAAPSGVLLGRIFAKVVRFYADFFKRAGAAFCGRRIHLAAHSMGNQVLEAFLASIQVQGVAAFPLFGEVLLLHADCDWNALESGRPLHKLPSFADRTHIYTHRSDDALLVSEQTKNAEKRLGRHGPRDLWQIPPRCIVVDCSGSKGKTTVRAATSELAGNVLASPAGAAHPVPVKERLGDHWGYLTRPAQIADILSVLAGHSTRAIATRTFREDRLFTLN